jgi:type I restriction enzyme M protein
VSVPAPVFSLGLFLLPFGLPGVNKQKEVGNANYLWISYFYAYLNETGRAGFVMASSATDSQGKDRDIRRALTETGHVDVMVSVGNNFFYTKSLPCSLWFFDKGKPAERLDRVLFIDASGECVKVTNNNRLTEENIAAIVDEFASREEKPHFAHLAEYDEVVENDYTLSVSTYVEAEDTRERVDIVKLNAEIQEIVARDENLRKEINQIIEDIEEA